MRRRRSPTARWGLLVALSAASSCVAGCNALFDIEPLPRAPEAPPATLERANLALALSATFPGFSTACAECLQTQCAAELNGCVSDGACGDYMACRWQNDMSPGGELRCELEHQRSGSEARSVTWQLLNCWENGCAQACEQGTQWDCVGNYSFPTPDPSGMVKVTQTLQTTAGAPLEGATVQYCGPLVDAAGCTGRAVSTVVSDASGVAQATLPVGGSLGGWTGYRQVEHPAMFPTRLQTNLIVPRSRNMLQQIVSLEEGSVMASLIQADTKLGNVLFQVFDCAHTGAEGVLIEATPVVVGGVIRDSTSQLLYTTSNTNRLALTPEATRSEGGGSGVLSNVIPNELIAIRAVRVATGDVVAEFVTQARAGELLLLEIHPDPR